MYIPGFERRCVGLCGGIPYSCVSYCVSYFLIPGFGRRCVVEYLIACHADVQATDDGEMHISK